MFTEKLVLVVEGPWSYEYIAQGRESASSRQLLNRSVIHKPSSWCRRTSKCSYIMLPQKKQVFTLFPEASRISKVLGMNLPVDLCSTSTGTLRPCYRMH